MITQQEKRTLFSVRPFDPAGEFQAAVELDRLRVVAARGAAVTILFQAIGFVLQLGGSVVLARLLNPSDFGVVAMVTTFGLLLSNFGVNGFTEAIIQRDRLDHQLASNLFWINVSAGMALMSAFAAVAPLMARFYGEPRVSAVATAISLTIFLSALSVQHLALLKRCMSFTVVSAIEIGARALSLVVSIALAWKGWSYWALVAGTIAQPLASCAAAWTFCGWIPGPPRRRAGTGAMVRFALNTYAFFTANYWTRNLDNLLVGSFFGPQALGLYKRAYDMTVLPIGQLTVPLNAVALPTLSRLTGDTEKYRRYVLRALATLAFLGMGLAAGLGLIGRDLFVFAFGQKWEEAGRLFTVFAPGIGAMMIYPSCIFIHLSAGKSERLLRWGLAEAAVFGCLFIFGLGWGPSGVAFAWMLASWTLLIPALWYAGQPVQLRIPQMLGVIWRYIVAAGLADAIAAAVVRSTHSADPMMRSLVGAVAFSGLYLAAVVVLHGSTEPLKQMIGLLRDAAPGRRRAARSHVVGGQGATEPA